MSRHHLAPLAATAAVAAAVITIGPATAAHAAGTASSTMDYHGVQIP